MTLIKKQSDTTLLPAPFIVGTGRCGTTLLRLMLDAHPNLAIPPETYFIPQIYSVCMNADGTATDHFMDSITGSRYWNDFHIDTEELRTRIHANASFDIGESLRAFYKLYAVRFEKQRWGDKTPVYVESMQLIQQILPEAHFIHLIRDGRDMALSVLKENWGPRSITAAAEWWVYRIKRARTQAQELDNYLEVRYEDLVSNARKTLKLICDFINLPWNEGILAYHKTAANRLDEFQSVQWEGGVLTPQQRKDKFRLTSEPPTKSRIGRWETRMTPRDINAFEQIAGPLLNDLGYRVNIDLTSQQLLTPWIDRLNQALSKVKTVVPDGARIILLDQEEWGIEGMIGSRLCYKFVEKSGQYWGPPADDENGISEVERLCNAGAEYLVCAWPAYWWLKHYPLFNRYLRENHQCLIENDDVIIFDLREHCSRAIG